MNWTQDNTLAFIAKIRERPVMWDATLPDHKNKIKRNRATEEVAKLMGISSKEVNYKWMSLRGQYKREKRRMMHIRKVNGPDAVRSCKWFAFNEMATLMQCSALRDSISDDEDSQHSNSSTLEFNKAAKDYTPEPKKPKLQEIPQVKTSSSLTNSFGEYIGEQLDQVDTFQRHVAEKLISEVLFLARTSNLDYSTKIESTRVQSSNVVHSSSSSVPKYPSSVFVHSNVTPQYILPVTQFVAASKPPPEVEPPPPEVVTCIPSPIADIDIPVSPAYPEIKVESLSS